MVKSAIEHRTWGDWPSIALSTEHVELEVVSEVGARVVSLRDKRRDREWLVQGEKPRELDQMAWAREEAVFAGRESFGWDECLPTTSPCADPLADDGRQPARSRRPVGSGRLPAARSRGRGRGAHLGRPHWDYRLRRLSFADEETCSSSTCSRAERRCPSRSIGHNIQSSGRARQLYRPARGLPGSPRWQHGIDLPAELAWPTAHHRGRETRDLACVRRRRGLGGRALRRAREGMRAVTPDGARLDLDWDHASPPLCASGSPTAAGRRTAEPPSRSPSSRAPPCMTHLGGALDAGHGAHPGARRGAPLVGAPAASPPESATSRSAPLWLA